MCAGRLLHSDPHGSPGSWLRALKGLLSVCPVATPQGTVNQELPLGVVSFIVTSLEKSGGLRVMEILNICSLK